MHFPVCSVASDQVTQVSWREVCAHGARAHRLQSSSLAAADSMGRSLCRHLPLPWQRPASHPGRTATPIYSQGRTSDQT